MSDESRLHDEVIQVARDLIRLDTTNAREPGLGNETLCAAYLQDYLARNGVEAELVAREPRPGERRRADSWEWFRDGTQSDLLNHRTAGPSRWRSSATRTSSPATRATGSIRRSRASSTTTAISGAAERST